jgi:hypothetical protein
MADVINKRLEATAYLRGVRAQGNLSPRLPVILFVGAVIVAWVLAWPAMALAAEDAGSLEHRVKAAFLYRFAGYVDWPPNAFARPDMPVMIAVIGADGLAGELEQVVVGRTVSERLVSVKRMKPGDSLNGMHVLFVGKSEAARLPQLVQAAQSRSILTVTEADGALRQGSVINFILAEQRVRFEISLDSAEKSGLKLSSRLLAVAQQVVTGTP